MNPARRSQQQHIGVTPVRQPSRHGLGRLIRAWLLGRTHADCTNVVSGACDYRLTQTARKQSQKCSYWYVLRNLWHGIKHSLIWRLRVNAQALLIKMVKARAQSATQQQVFVTLGTKFASVACDRYQLVLGVMLM